MKAVRCAGQAPSMRLTHEHQSSHLVCVGMKIIQESNRRLCSYRLLTPQTRSWRASLCCWRWSQQTRSASVLGARRWCCVCLSCASRRVCGDVTHPRLVAWFRLAHKATSRQRANRLSTAEPGIYLRSECVHERTPKDGEVVHYFCTGIGVPKRLLNRRRGENVR